VPACGTLDLYIEIYSELRVKKHNKIIIEHLLMLNQIPQMMLYKFQIILICILFSLIGNGFAQATGAKKNVKPKAKPLVDVVQVPIPPPVVNPAIVVIENIMMVQPKFKTMNISKMMVGLDINGRDINANVNLKIRKDSAMHVSVQFMGAEVLKMEFTVDSLRVFNKMDSKFYEDDYAYLSEVLGLTVDFFSIQAMLSNQIFSVGEKGVSSEKTILDETVPALRKLDLEKNGIHQSTFVMTDNRIAQVQLDDRLNGYQLKMNYSELSLEDGVNFPKKLTIQFLRPKTNNVYVFDIQKMSFDKPIVFSNNNPARYIPAELDELIKR